MSNKSVRLSGVSTFHSTDKPLPPGLLLISLFLRLPEAKAGAAPEAAGP